MTHDLQAGGKDRFTHLDTVRAFTILYVVLGHAIGYVPISQSLWDTIMYVIHPVAVPIFFLCDGFLFSVKALNGGSFNYKNHIWNSATRLLVPWVVFSALYVVARAVFEYFGLLRDPLVIGHSPVEVVLAAYASKTAPQMYFLPALFMIRLCGFATWRVFSLPTFGVVLAFLGYTVGYRIFEDVVEQMAIDGSDPVVHALWGMQFFLAGAVLARLHGALLKVALPLSLFFIALTFCCYFICLDNSVFKAFVQYSNILGTYLLFVALPWWHRPLTFIGARSMGIYLLHAPVLIKVVSLIFIFLIPNVVIALIFTHLVTFGVSLGMTMIIEKSSKLRVLFGVFAKSSKTA